MHRKLLSVGSNLSLLGLRNRVFEAAGYEVTPAKTAAQALAAMGSREFDVVIVGHSLSPTLQRTVASAAKKQGVPVLVLHANPFAEQMPDVVANLCGTDGAATILDELSDLFVGHPQFEQNRQPRLSQIEHTIRQKSAALRTSEITKQPAHTAM